MRHMRVAAYAIVTGNVEELTSIAEKAILPLLSEAPGFIDYGLLDAGHNTVVEVSIWENRREAQKPTSTAATWVRENLADRVRLVKTYVGDLALSRSVRIRTLADVLTARAGGGDSTLATAEARRLL